MLSWGVGKAASARVTGLEQPDPDYIPSEFENNLVSHILSNQLFPEEAPVLLLILGAPGTGKSHQSRRFCHKYGMYYEPTNGADFQGTEGQSKRNLVKAYTRAVKGIFVELDPPYAAPARQSMLLIDDFHLSLASVLSDNFSQNSQIFMAALMTGCTEPITLFDGRDGDRFARVPIIATANSSKELYKPLLRHGRVRIFHWEPSEKDRQQIGLYYLSLLGRTDTHPLLQKHRDEPPVFFRELVNSVREHQIVSIYRSGGRIDPDTISAKIQAMRLTEIERLADDVKKSEVLRSMKYD